MDSNEKVWLVTGAGRGLGAGIVRAALAAGHRIVATGRIDVLVNNAGNFYAGFFEELTPDQVRRQIETLLFGPMNVTRAVLPMMRRQRAGLVLTISSTAGLVAGAFCTGYAAGTIAFLSGLDGKQPCDPAKLASALVQLAALEKPPLRFVAGTDAMAPIEAKARALLAQIDAHRTLSASLATQPQET